MKIQVNHCSICNLRIYGRMNRDGSMRYVENQADSSSQEKRHQHEKDAKWEPVPVWEDMPE